MIAIIEAVLQVTLVLIVFIAGYRVAEVIGEEYAHDKNMHEQRARTKRRAALRVVQKGRRDRDDRG